jgi:excisionase family DNA binding protein
MIPTAIEPGDHAAAIAEHHEHHHDGWFEATPDLIAFIAAQAQDTLRSLLGDAPAGASEESLVDIDELAAMLNCSVVTVRRMIDRKQIPFYRLGRAYRFSPSDVLASLQQR